MGSSANAVILFIVLAVAAVVAVIVGTQLGTEDYYGASLWVLIGLGILYIAKLHQYTWQLALLFTSMGFIYRPLGFAVNASHICFALGAGLAALYLFTSDRRAISPQIRTPALRHLQIAIAVWLIYGGIHFLWNRQDPFIPGEFVLSNALKNYFDAFAMPALLLWFTMKPTGIRVGPSWPRTIMFILFAAVSVNIVIRIYLISLGIGLYDRGVEAMEDVGPLYVPVINLFPGPYTLRLLGPIAVGISFMFLTSPKWFGRQGILTKAVTILTFALGIAGTLVSGGRGAMLIAGFYIFLIAIMRRRIILVSAIALAGLVFIAALNIFSDQIRRAPFYVQRTVQYFLIEKQGAAQISIQSSTEWRQELAEMALAEWRSDPRIFWTGRSAYGYSMSDIYVTQQIGGYEAALQSSLRRGYTHNLVTDLLVQYGLIGFILYLIIILALIRFLWSMMKLRTTGPPELGDLSILCVVMLVTSTIIAAVASGWLEAHLVWLVLIFIAGRTAYDNAQALEAARARQPARPRAILAAR